MSTLAFDIRISAKKGLEITVDSLQFDLQESLKKWLQSGAAE